MSELEESKKMKVVQLHDETPNYMSGQQLHIYGEILPHDGRKFPQFSRVAEMEKIYLIPKKISSF